VLERSEEVEEGGLKALLEEKEGEIWISSPQSSPSAGICYWGREELSERTFINELQNHVGRR
jgi:hypothetical protein